LNTFFLIPFSAVLLLHTLGVGHNYYYCNRLSRTQI
jgi:hypothetical protein